MSHLLDRTSPLVYTSFVLTSEALAAWRASHALTHAAAGRAAKTSRQAVWAWERGRGHPSPEQLRLMNDAHPGLTGLLGLCPRRRGR